MDKLKAGNRVIVLDSNYSELKIGSKHIVSFIDSEGYPEIKDNDGQTWYFDLNQLQKIES
jgi:hypothetical protein